MIQLALVLSILSAQLAGRMADCAAAVPGRSKAIAAIELDKASFILPSLRRF
jgi:hypothetical protein